MIVTKIPEGIIEDAIYIDASGRLWMQMRTQTDIVLMHLNDSETDYGKWSSFTTSYYGRTDTVVNTGAFWFQCTEDMWAFNKHMVEESPTDLIMETMCCLWRRLMIDYYKKQDK